MWLREADTRIAHAGAEVAAALRLGENDLGPTQPSQVPSSVPDACRAVLAAGDGLHWGMLVNDDGKLHVAGDLIYYSATLHRGAARERHSAWHQTMAAFYNTGCVDGAITSSRGLINMGVPLNFREQLNVGHQI